METERTKLPPPPRLITSLGAGFDAVASHIAVISLPVLLDLFLWLGPHLRLKQLLQSLIEQLPALFASVSSNLQDPAAVQKAWSQFFEQFNLFSLLRTVPVGVTSLMNVSMPVETPFGKAVALEADSFFGVAGWWLLLVFLGWVLGSLYFHWVSGVSLRPQTRRPVFQSISQTVLLSVIWLTVLFLFGLPAFMLFSVLALVSPLLAQLALFILALISLWLVLPVFFSPHGIFTYQQNAFSAILNSLRMVRFTLPTSGLFLLSIVLISQGLDFLWRTPPGSSWWTLVGIAGHAFVSTALLAASFIYYRDVNSWLQVVLEQLKTQTTSARA